jgi:hypothetical protein
MATGSTASIGVGLRLTSYLLCATSIKLASSLADVRPISNAYEAPTPPFCTVLLVHSPCI